MCLCAADFRRNSPNFLFSSWASPTDLNRAAMTEDSSAQEGYSTILLSFEQVENARSYIDFALLFLPPAGGRVILLVTVLGDSEEDAPKIESLRSLAFPSYPSSPSLQKPGFFHLRISGEMQFQPYRRANGLLPFPGSRPAAALGKKFLRTAPRPVPPGHPARRHKCKRAS